MQYRDPTSFNITNFEPIHLDNDFIVTHSETSDNRPYITSNTSPETTQAEQTSNIVPPNTREYSIQQEPEGFVNLFQDQQPHQLNQLYPQLPQTSDTPQLNPFETAAVQNETESSEESEPTVQNTQSITITNDSNLVQIPIHNITLNQNNNPNQDNTSSTIQDNTFILSTSPTNTTQPSQTQRSPRQNYDPPSIPPQFSTQTHTHNYPQPGSSNTQHTNTVHFQTPTPP